LNIQEIAMPAAAAPVAPAASEEEAPAEVHLLPPDNLAQLTYNIGGETQRENYFQRQIGEYRPRRET
jgi:hypothetical protein